MITTNRKLLAVPALSFAALLAMSGAAVAAEGVGAGDLTPVPLNGEDDGAGGFVVEVNGTMISFALGAENLAVGPHAAHIHYGEQAAHECPTEAADTNTDGVITTPEGVPLYGGIQVSLTTEGDTSPASALAIDRFASESDFEYAREGIQVTEEVAAAILSGESVVVIHGVDADDSGAYDGPPSELDPSVPQEATLPALCGIVVAEVAPEPTPTPTPTETPAPTQPTPTPTPAPQVMDKPAGGVATGDGATAGIENAGALGLGTLALLTAGALVARRRFTGDRG